jgi:tetratricopeptide (TPR) repeat protein
MGRGLRDDAAKTADTEKARRQAAALQEKATASYGAGKLAAAVRAGTRAAEIYQAAGDVLAASQALSAVAMALTRQGRPAQAADVAGRAVAMTARGNDRAAEAGMLRLHGEALAAAARFEEAIPVLEAAAEAYRELGAEPIALSSRAGALSLRHRHDEAVSVREQVLALHESAGDQFQMATALTQFGYALQEAARFDEAVAAHLRARTLYQEAGRAAWALEAGRDAEGARRGTYPMSSLRDKELVITNPAHREGDAAYGEGMSAMKARRYAVAADAYREAARVFAAMSDPSCESRSHFNLGLALYELKRLTEAVQSFDRAIAVASTAGEDEVLGDARKALDIALQRLYPSA